MPRNGSGQYNLPYDWNDDKANGIKVLASRMQAQDEDIGTALTGSVAADGQTPLTGDLDFNNNKAVDLADGSDLGDAINVSQAQTGETQFYGVSTTTPAGTDGEDYDIAAFATISVYPTYTKFSFICHFTCIINPNARLDALAVKNLVKSDGANGYIALEDSDMVADKEYIAIYNEDISTTEIVIENPENPIFEKITVRNADGIKKATTSAYGVSYLPKQITITNGTDANHDLDFTAFVMDFDDGSGQALVSALIKRIDAAWVAGTNQGGLDTGTVANNTPYYIFAIYNPTTLVSDILYSASRTSPTLPSGFTKKEYKGACYTDGSANIRIGTWTYGKSIYKFTLATPTLSLSTTTPAATRTAISMVAPAGVFVWTGLELIDNDVIDMYIYITGDDQADYAPTATFSTLRADTNYACKLQDYWLTNSSGQIYYRSDDGGVSEFYVRSLGWYEYL
jgi:hypothetical protein